MTDLHVRLVSYDNAIRGSSSAESILHTFDSLADWDLEFEINSPSKFDSEKLKSSVLTILRANDASNHDKLSVDDKNDALIVNSPLDSSFSAPDSAKFRSSHSTETTVFSILEEKAALWVNKVIERSSLENPDLIFLQEDILFMEDYSVEISRDELNIFLSSKDTYVDLQESLLLASSKFPKILLLSKLLLFFSFKQLGDWKCFRFSLGDTFENLKRLDKLTDYLAHVLRFEENEKWEIQKGTTPLVTETSKKSQALLSSGLDYEHSLLSGKKILLTPPGQHSKRDSSLLKLCSSRSNILSVMALRRLFTLLLSKGQEGNCLSTLKALKMIVSRSSDILSVEETSKLYLEIAQNMLRCALGEREALMCYESALDYILFGFRTDESLYTLDLLFYCGDCIVRLYANVFNDCLSALDVVEKLEDSLAMVKEQMTPKQLVGYEKWLKSLA